MVNPGGPMIAVGGLRLPVPPGSYRVLSAPAASVGSAAGLTPAAGVGSASGVTPAASGAPVADDPPADDPSTTVSHVVDATDDGCPPLVVGPVPGL